MSNEIRVQCSLQIKNGFLDYASRPTAFLADMATVGGPSPGEISVALAGTDVDLSQLTDPGFVWLMNLDPTNYVEFGVYDSVTGKFYPLGELLPGQFTQFMLSRFLGAEFGTGTGTGGFTGTTRFRIKATGSACRVVVHAFER